MRSPSVNCNVIEGRSPVPSSKTHRFLKDPPILVLDEATSAVDNETEAAIQKSLTKITQNQTTIVIAHRLSTIHRADCIYVMDEGRIVEQGTHDELLRLSGRYTGLDMQLGKNLSDVA